MSRLFYQCFWAMGLILLPFAFSSFATVLHRIQAYLGLFGFVWGKVLYSLVWLEILYSYSWPWICSPCVSTSQVLWLQVFIPSGLVRLSVYYKDLLQRIQLKWFIGWDICKETPLSIWTGHCPGTSIGSTTQPSISCPMEGFCFLFCFWGFIT